MADWSARAFAGRSDLRPVTPEALHVTLVFLGYRPEREIDAIAAAAFEPLRGLAPPSLRPLGVVAVPPRRPRLFALELDDDGGRCVALQAAASGALEAARFHRPEKRPFWPHVTLARVKRDARADPVEGNPEVGEFTATEVTLYRSLLSSRGARYEPLERLVLARPRDV